MQPNSKTGENQVETSWRLCKDECCKTTKQTRVGTTRKTRGKGKAIS